MLIVFQKLYVICVVSKPKLYTILHILFCARIYVYWFVYVPLKKMPSHGIMLSALPYIHIYTRQNREEDGQNEQSFPTFFHLCKFSISQKEHFASQLDTLYLWPMYVSLIPKKMYYSTKLVKNYI